MRWSHLRDAKIDAELSERTVRCISFLPPPPPPPPFGNWNSDQKNYPDPIADVLANGAFAGNETNGSAPSLLLHKRRPLRSFTFSHFSGLSWKPPGWTGIFDGQFPREARYPYLGRRRIDRVEEWIRVPNTCDFQTFFPSRYFSTSRYKQSFNVAQSRRNRINM